MPLPTSHDAGTISVSAGGTVVTGSGAGWTGAGLRAGDVFWCAGLSVSIASIDGANSLTLAFPWPGAAQSGAAYEIRYTPDAQRVLASARELIETIGDGDLQAIAALNSAADRVPYFNGPGSASLATLTSFGRSLIARTATAGQFPVSTGPNASTMRTLIGGIGSGALFETSGGANNGTIRFGEWQICTGRIQGHVSGTTTANGDIYISDPVTWTYPTPFSSAPMVQANAEGAGRWGGTAGTPSTTSCDLREWNASSNASQLFIQAVAIGRH